MKSWVFLAPHFDDVVLSVGGLVWELTHRGEKVEIWTICAGDLPSGQMLSDYARMLHIFFGLEGQNVPFVRSQEDAAACKVLGAGFRRYTVPDCIYRNLPGTDDPIIKVPDDIHGELEPIESYLIPPVTDFLRKNLPEEYELAIPLTIGHHRDHVLVRKAAEQLGIPLWHYVDYPYIIQEQYDLKEWIPQGATEFSLIPTAPGINAWQDGIACNRSQIVFFWPDLTEMRTGIETYARSGGGVVLTKF
jgi:LmbE family N-acetylglucosaminyl deacetylase